MAHHVARNTITKSTETNTTLIYGLEEYQFADGTNLIFFFFLPKFLQFLLFILPLCFTIYSPIPKLAFE
jgi:hypothetical protein